MSQAKLILSQSPPPWVPLRFFVTAPLFAIAAAGLVLWHGEITFTSRWSTSLLAATHLLVLGFMAMVMTGALIQVVSVLIGGKIPAIKTFSSLVFLALLLGTACLTIGFITSDSTVMICAVLLLSVAFLLFGIIMLLGVVSGSARQDSGIGIGLALFSLFITVAIGLWLASGYALEEIALARNLTDTHLTWGLIGWVGILVITVGYEVVPMFQLTPPYPTRLTPWLGPALLFALIVWSSHLFNISSTIQVIGGFVIACILSMFAIVTLQLQHKRKKKQVDAVVWFWRSGMICLLASAIIWTYAQSQPGLLQIPEWQILIGCLLIIGFAISTINGMLYKIIPFLIWLHLSIRVTELKLSRRMIPNIKTMIPDIQAKYQFYLHLISLALFFLSAFKPEWFVIPACILYMTSNILLLLNLLQALRLFSKTEKEIISAGVTC